MTPLPREHKMQLVTVNAGQDFTVVPRFPAQKSAVSLTVTNKIATDQVTREV